MDPRVERILNLINQLYGDTSATPAETRELMEEISSDVDAKLEALD